MLSAYFFLNFRMLFRQLGARAGEMALFFNKTSNYL